MNLPKVAVCIPYYRQVEGDFAMALMRLGIVSAAHAAMAPIATRSCYVEDNRNGCIQYALNMGIDFDWVLWIDADMVFPGDALLRLIGHDKDIVGAHYRQRTPPHRHVGVYEDRNIDLMAPGLHRMVQMPTGLLLTRFDIYRKMGYPWFKPGTHDEPRDDVYFCRRAVALGYEIWCDHDLTREVVHITEQQIPWFAPEQIVRVSGAEIDNASTGEEAKQRAAASARRFRVNQSAAWASLIPPPIRSAPRAMAGGIRRAGSQASPPDRGNSGT